MFPSTYPSLFHCSKLLLEFNTGGRAYRGAGYGLEVPRVYQFYGPKPYIDKLREVDID